MVGVSGPLVADSATDGARFLLGLTIAGLAGSTMLALVGVAFSLLVQRLVSFDGRVIALVAWAVLLGGADLANRTPQWFRQVPQRLVRELGPATLGSVWGFDLGLIVTTKKVTSLAWLAIGGSVLLRPALVPVCVIGVGLTTSLSIVWWSLRVRNDTECLMKRQQDWMARARVMSGSAMLLTAVTVSAVAIG
ncbi:MAG: hypothetical protein ABI140_17765 [Jatrophihabitantaceae bacterium]